MRCLSFAHAWRGIGGKASFLSYCPSPSLRRRIESRGFALETVPVSHPSSGDLKKTLERLSALTSPSRPRPWLILDGYHFDTGYHRALRMAGHRLAVLDDTAHLSEYDVEVLLNQNPGADRLRYRCGPRTLSLLGPRYILLRRELLSRDHRRSYPERVRRILLTMGGSDPRNATAAVLEALRGVETEGAEVVAVLGPDNPHRELLRRRFRDAPFRLRLEKDPRYFLDLMAGADLAISAGGITCWELAFLGVPTALVITGKNQRNSAEGLEKAGAALILGEAGKTRPGIMAKKIGRLCRDRGLRRGLGKRAREFVDGKGAARVVRALAAFGGGWDTKELVLRPAAKKDADILLAWRNDPQTRRASRSTGKVGKEEHRLWLKKSLRDKNRKLFIAEEDGMAVGSVRSDLSKGVHELSWTVAPGARGRGIGGKIVALLASRLTAPIRAEIKVGHEASAKIALSTGMRFDRKEGGILHYKRDRTRGCWA